MFKRLVLIAIVSFTSFIGLVAALPGIAAAEPVPGPMIEITQAQASAIDGDAAGTNRVVPLPDDWAESRPRFDGVTTYRTRFDRPAGVDSRTLMALAVDRACSHLEVVLNGELVHSGGPTPDAEARQCAYPQLVPLPGKLLLAQGNQLEIQVQGHALQRVAARERAGGLSALKIGTFAALATAHEQQMFWRVTAPQIATLVVAVLGVVAVGLFALGRREAPIGYLVGLALLWSVMSLRLWWQLPPWSDATSEFLACAGFAPLTALAIQFLLSHANLRSRWIEGALVVQLVLVPATLWLAGPARLFAMTSFWYPLFAIELLVVVGLHLAATWRDKRTQFLRIAAVLILTMLAVLYEQATQHGLLALQLVPFTQLLAPLLFLAIGIDLMRGFARPVSRIEPVPQTQAQDDEFEMRIAQVTAEQERNFAQLAELRVEQVTEKERKRIAGDLHDDLGAKLLTIVHTSDSERVSTLAREALEEMRLSVKGLTGKPMRLADALADWRAETVQRLGQANIEADWRNPAEEIEQLLPARGFVQTTRILRECVSNIIKHSGASHCKVRCSISDRQFGLTVQDNGKGIPMELDGKLDRGHGMTSMKHRAKQMQGQCLVESGPGYGTVIRLTLPL